jgi:hypothetical protein
VVEVEIIVYLEVLQELLHQEEQEVEDQEEMVLPSVPGTSGTVNTGGGGGGAGGSPNNATGGSGGSGIVIVRAPSARTFTVAPGTNTTSSTPGGCKVATFTVSGTLTVS